MISDNDNALASNNNPTAAASAMASNESHGNAYKRMGESNFERSIKDEADKVFAGPNGRTQPVKKKR